MTVAVEWISHQISARTEQEGTLVYTKALLDKNATTTITDQHKRQKQQQQCAVESLALYEAGCFRPKDNKSNKVRAYVLKTDSLKYLNLWKSVTAEQV